MGVKYASKRFSINTAELKVVAWSAWEWEGSGLGDVRTCCCASLAEVSWQLYKLSGCKAAVRVE